MSSDNESAIETTVTTASNKDFVVSRSHPTHPWCTFTTIESRKKALIKSLPDIINYPPNKLEDYEAALRSSFENSGLVSQPLDHDLTSAEKSEGLKTVMSYSAIRELMGDAKASGTQFFIDESGKWEVVTSREKGVERLSISTNDGDRFLTEEECGRIVTELANDHAWDIIRAYDAALGRYPVWFAAKKSHAMVRQPGSDNCYRNKLKDWNGMKIDPSLKRTVATFNGANAEGGSVELV